MWKKGGEEIESQQAEPLAYPWNGRHSLPAQMESRLCSLQEMTGNAAAFFHPTVGANEGGASKGSIYKKI